MPDSATNSPRQAPLRCAIVYDFDGTLARGNLQERSFIPEIAGLSHDEFWLDVRKTARANNADEILVYMQKMIEAARTAGKPLTRAQLKSHGRDPDLFDGLDHWFDRIDAFAADNGLELDHYVISSGIHEMIEGCAIYPRFRQVFASRFLYENGEAVWPAVAINYTTKTQFLFRINKGIETVWDTEAVNRWIPEGKRPLPFERMIFLGDGDTDIPSMKMVASQGGCAIAVLDPYRWSDPLGVARIHTLIAEDRVSFVAPADYLPGGALDVIVKGALGRIALRAGLPQAERAVSN